MPARPKPKFKVGEIVVYYDGLEQPGKISYFGYGSWSWDDPVCECELRPQTKRERGPEPTRKAVRK